MTVAWAATGDVVLKADPPLPQIGAKDSSGSDRFQPAQPTRFVLLVTRMLSKASAEADVAVAPREREYGGLAMCPAPTGPVSLSVPLGEPQLSSSVKVRSVTNMNRRTLAITKDGVNASIPAGGSSAEFNGRAGVGTWELRATPEPGETCDGALAALANRLTFKLVFACGE